MQRLSPRCIATSSRPRKRGGDIHHPAKAMVARAGIPECASASYPSTTTAPREMSDNGCQPTSTAFMRTCGTLAIRQAFTSYKCPNGNADTERVMRTLKEEWRSFAMKQ